jgi:hypothetical protein
MSFSGSVATVHSQDFIKWSKRRLHSVGTPLHSRPGTKKEGANEKNYIDNLSEEARKGMQEKSEQGIWPSLAPLGYRNVAGPDGKKIIAVEPESASIVANLFEWYAIGTILLQEATRRARAAGPARTSSAHYLRSGLKPTRTSSEKSSGCSQAAKWLPLGSVLKWMSLG